MSKTQSPEMPPLFDPVTGQLRPLSPEERRARSEALRRTLDAIAEISDETDTDEIWDDIMRGIAAARGDEPADTEAR